MAISRDELEAFSARLRRDGRSPGTIAKYLHDAAGFAVWLLEYGGRNFKVLSSHSEAKLCTFCVPPFAKGRESLV